MNFRERTARAVAEEEGLPLAPTRDQGGGTRSIPKGHKFESSALKPLARSLFSTSVALGHALSAYRQFARIKSSSISPDGNLGGRGYVLSVVEARGMLQQACELLSKVSDTLHDEANAPHWKPAIADLSENESEDIEEMLDETDQVLTNPESVGDEAVQEIEQRNDKTASSRLPGDGLDPTPRVKTRDMPTSTTDGSWNETDPKVTDEWGLKQGSLETWGASEVPSDKSPFGVRDYGRGYGSKGEALDPHPSDHSELPDGGELPVTRSDYYREGPALNMWGSSETPHEPKIETTTKFGPTEVTEDLAQARTTHQRAKNV